MGFYNWYYFTEEEYKFAEETIKFLEDRLSTLEEDDEKIKRIKLSITALKYYYSI